MEMIGKIILGFILWVFVARGFMYMGKIIFKDNDKFYD